METDLIEALIKMIPQLASMGPIGYVLLVIVGLLGVYLAYLKIRNIFKKKQIQHGKDANQAGQHTGSEASDNANDLNEVRDEVDDFLGRDDER
jgi:hypothetical protein